MTLKQLKGGTFFIVKDVSYPLGIFMKIDEVDNLNVVDHKGHLRCWADVPVKVLDATFRDETGEDYNYLLDADD